MDFLHGFVSRVSHTDPLECCPHRSRPLISTGSSWNTKITLFATGAVTNATRCAGLFCEALPGGLSKRCGRAARPCAASYWRQLPSVGLVLKRRGLPSPGLVTYDLVAPCTAGASGCACLRPSCLRQTHISSGARPAEAGLHWWVREWAGGWDLSWRPAVFPAARSTQLQHTLHARACWRRFAWCTQML